jgi:hypothetical protein
MIIFAQNVVQTTFKKNKYIIIGISDIQSIIFLYENNNGTISKGDLEYDWWLLR